jgi:hypothetical protein
MAVLLLAGFFPQMFLNLLKPVIAEFAAK